MIVGTLSTVDRPLLIAEIGNNHEGSLARAQELVRRAAEAGVDAVKFQTYRTRLFGNLRDRVRYERLERFELSFSDFEQLHRHAKDLGLLFISTPLDLESAAFLGPLVDAYKIASGDITFYPLIERVCETGKPIILSSGASELDQIVKTKQRIEARWRGSSGAPLCQQLPCAARASQSRYDPVSQGTNRRHRRLFGSYGGN